MNRFGRVFAVALIWDGRAKDPCINVASGRSLCVLNISYRKPQNFPVTARNQFDENPMEWGEIPLIGMQQKFSISPKIWIITLQKWNNTLQWNLYYVSRTALSLVLHCLKDMKIL